MLIGSDSLETVKRTHSSYFPSEDEGSYPAIRLTSMAARERPHAGLASAAVMAPETASRGAVLPCVR